MSTAAPTTGSSGRLRLPAWAAPRPQGERDPASRDVRSIETVIIVLIGLLLAAAVVYDVVLQVRLNTRESADRATWRAYEHVTNVKTRLDVRTLEHGTTDFVCRSTTTVASQALHQVRLCLMIGGPTVNDRRQISGGYYIPPKASDRFLYRYGCFGLPAQRKLCGAPTAAAAAGAWATFTHP